MHFTKFRLVKMLKIKILYFAKKCQNLNSQITVQKDMTHSVALWMDLCTLMCNEICRFWCEQGMASCSRWISVMCWWLNSWSWSWLMSCSLLLHLKN